MEEATGENLSSALPRLPTNVRGKESAEAGLLSLTGKSDKRGPWRQDQGVSPEGGTAAHCSPGCKSHGVP